MEIQSANNQYIIQIEQSAIQLIDLQRFIDFIRFKNIVSKSQATEPEIEQLADELTQSGWNTIKDSLMARIQK